MTAVAVSFGLLAGLLHVGFWVIEALWWSRPKIWRLFGVASQTEADTLAFGMLNQGYYNLFLGIGAIVGSILVATKGSGAVLLGYCCLFMLGAAGVLLVARRTMVRAALIQGLPPAVALAALAAI